VPEAEGGEAVHYRGGYDFSGLVKRAQELRRLQTPAETLFWDLVRNRQFLGLKFRRQHQVGDYILDFYCHEIRTAIELDGEIHTTRRDKDKKRDAYLKAQGIRVIRIRNEELLESPAAILQKFAKALPLPLGEGRGEGRFSEPLNRKDHVLMIDARNIYRKVTRKIYDFSPEQEQNILAIVRLYRGQPEKYLDVVATYCRRMLAEGEGCFLLQSAGGEASEPLPSFQAALAALLRAITPFLETLPDDGQHAAALEELVSAIPLFKNDMEGFQKTLAEQQAAWEKQKTSNGELKKAVDRLAPLSEASRNLVKQTDLLYKLACRLIETIESSPRPLGEGPGVRGAFSAVTRARKAADEARALAVEQLKQVRYFWKQARWLTERFPDAELRDVEGLVKLVDRSEIATNDWSLTPGRYVGVAPEEEDENFDFEEALREIHVELEDLNAEAVQLAATIKKNFEELGI
jgi:very-short-patch-repair endonuclease/type I restriction-modification system DNA methylase subunit